MKKIILSLGLLAGVSAAADAQGVRFGVKAGAALTTLTGDNVSGVKNKVGFLAGGLVNFGLSDLISIQPEVLYSQKGAKSSSNSDTKLRLNYIDVPIMVKVNAGGLFFEAGPQVGYLAAAKATDGTNTSDVASSFDKFDYGYAAGLGFMADNGPMIGLRYNGGIGDINKTTVSGSKTHNSAFQLYLGYLFGGK